MLRHTHFTSDPVWSIKWGKETEDAAFDRAVAGVLNQAPVFVRVFNEWSMIISEVYCRLLSLLWYHITPITIWFPCCFGANRNRNILSHPHKLLYKGCYKNRSKPSQNIQEFPWSSNKLLAPTNTLNILSLN